MAIVFNLDFGEWYSLAQRKVWGNQVPRRKISSLSNFPTWSPMIMLPVPSTIQSNSQVLWKWNSWSKWGFSSVLIQICYLSSIGAS